MPLKGPPEPEALGVGDLAPWFRQACVGQDAPFSFDMAAGRFVALCFYGAAGSPRAREALAIAEARPGLFDGVGLSLFGVTAEPSDASDPRLRPRAGVRHLLDVDGRVRAAFAVGPADGWIILDPRLRVIARFPQDGEGTRAAMGYLETAPSPAAYFGDAPAPVLLVPHVLEPDLCARLIAHHGAVGGAASDILSEGRTLANLAFKSRRDCEIADPALVRETRARIGRRVVPEIRHAFQFEASRLERLVIACYDAAEGGRFGPHRDNTVAASAHRRFAVSINLNADFEGGGLVFPEYGARAYRPAAGAALVFSCSLMHAVTPITRGRRYAVLPFLYDEAAAAGRAAAGS